MRYERMLFAGLMAALCYWGGAVFLAPCLEVAREPPWSALYQFHGRARGVLVMGSIGASLLCAGLAFTLFTLIKLELPGKESNLHYYELARKAGWLFIAIGAILGLLPVVVQAFHAAI